MVGASMLEHQEHTHAGAREAAEPGKQAWSAHTTEQQSSMLDMDLPQLQPHIAWQLGKHGWASSADPAECSPVGWHLLYSGQTHKSIKDGAGSKAQAPGSSKRKDAGM